MVIVPVPRVAVVGVGYWGPNIVRNLMEIDPSSIAAVCDLDPLRLEAINQHYPALKTTTNFDDILTDSSINAVMLVLPPALHPEMAEKALRAGKHLFIEKPLALNFKDACRTVKLADQLDLQLMVGLTYCHNTVIQYIGKIIKDGRLGPLTNIYSWRLNLNEREKHENVIWMLAPHDISIIDRWIGEYPQEVRAKARSVVNPNLEDEVYVEMQYASGLVANFHFSWLEPAKIRRLLIVGGDEVLVYDEINDKYTFSLYANPQPGQAWPNDFDEVEQMLSALGSAVEVVDCLDQYVEPLNREVRHFLQCLRTGKRPLTNGNMAMAGVKVIQAIEHSANNNSRPVAVGKTEG